MRSVMYLVKNNIKHKTGAFKGIIVLMAIIVFSFSGSVSNSKNLSVYLNDSLDHYNIGDIVMTYEYDKLTDTVTDGLDANANVNSWRVEPLLYVNMECFVDGKNKNVDTRLVKQKDEIKLFNDDSSGFVKDVPKLEKGEVYVSFSLGKVEKLAKGDKLEIQTTPDTKETFIIKGFVEDPLYGTSLVAYENFFICAEDFDRISKGVDEGTVNHNYIYKVKMLHIFAKDGFKDFKLVKQLNDECGLVDNSMLYVTRSELVSYTSVYADTGTSLLYAFVALLAIVVALMMLNSINSTMEMQYVDLGILKSQGFTLWQIRLSYLIQYVLALIIGSVIGIIISIPLLAVLGKMFMTVTGIYTDCKIDFFSCGLISLAMIVIFIFFLIMTTRKLGKISPVNALNNAHKDVHFTSRLNMPLKQRSLSFSISLRQISSGFKHYLFILIITVILMFFMATVLDLCRGLNFDDLFGRSNTDVDIKLFKEFEEKDMERVRSRISELDNGSDVVFNSYIDNIQADGILYGASANSDIGRFTKPLEGKICEYDNEIMITKIVADELEKGIGDTVTISNSGHSNDYMIVGLMQTASQTGRMIYMTLDGGKKIDMGIQTAMVFLSDHSKKTDAEKLLNEEFGDILISKSKADTREYENLKEMIDVLMIVIMLVVIGVSAVFLLVAITIICKITFLRERTNTGIFKANGFTTGDLRRQFSIRFLIIGIVGSLIGSGIAALLTNKVLSGLMRIVGLTDFTKTLSLTDVVIPASVICGCFLIFSYISSAMIKNVQTTELICE